MAALFVEDIVVDEGDGFVDIIVRLTEPATQVVSVNYITGNDTASAGAGGDYTTVSGTLNFALGDTSKVVRVFLTNDTTVENLQNFTFNLNTPVGATLADASAMVSIVDNDTIVATPSLFVRDVVVDEQAGRASFVVLLGGPKGQASNSVVTVNYATSNSTSNATATAGSDYTATSGTLTFAAGETVKTVVVNLLNDATAEGQERFNLNLSSASGATILDGQGVAVIGANDAVAVAQPKISVSDMVVSEADGYVDIVVSLSAPGQSAVSVNYITGNDTASAGAGGDYRQVSGTLNFAVGETTKVVRVELTEDGAVENLQNFTFNLNTPVGATLADASAMVSTVDNDTIVATPSLFVRDVVVDEQAGTASFVVLLGGPKGQASNSVVTVNYATSNSTSNATATAGSDYTATSGTLTFAAGETVKTVVVDLLNDATAEGQERFNLNVSSASGATILDGQGVAVIGANDAVAVAQPKISVSDMVVSEADGYVDIVVSLSAPGQSAVSVNYITGNDTASAGAGGDYRQVSGTLNFAVGETTKVVRVELTEDGAVENLQNFTFNLNTPVGATLADASAMVSIVDNDTIVATPSLFVRDVVVDEQAGRASFVVLLGGPTGQAHSNTVTVNYATSNSTSNATATAGSDYTATSGTLTFAAGETVKTVVVDLLNDATAEGQERFNLNVSSASGATILDGQGVAVIGANDAVAVAQPKISVSDMVVSEADGYVDIVVSLSAPGQSAVSVNYITGNDTASAGAGGDYRQVSGTLNFAVGETTKVVRVELTEDGAVENLQNFTFNLNTPVGATLADASAMVSIVDNDTIVATPSLFVRDVVVDEQAGRASFVVLLGGPTGQAHSNTVTVNYATSNSTSNATATAGSDYTATSGTLTFAAGETVKTVVVDLLNDATAEGQERFNLNVSSASGATILDGRGVAVIGANDAVAVAQPKISVSDMVVSEADGYVDIVVSLSAPGQSAVSVNYITGNDTASAGAGGDYRQVSGTLNFAVGETSKVVRVELLENASVEPLETFRFNLSGAVNASLANTFATITIADNDTGFNVYSYGISDDIYTVIASTDVIIENLGGGNDLVNASVSYTLPANVENLTLTGAAAINGTGNTLNNVLTGNSAANVLTGGVGNDTYVVGAGDTVVENPGEGTDTVQSALTYTLGANVENLTLTGAAAINGTGNTLNNVLTGNSAANVLTGGVGNDTYVVGAGDTVVENPGEGTDTVQSALTYTLGANVENLTLTGAAAINGTGNALNNVFTGNSAANVLTGGVGNDTYVVGAGDTVVENLAEGTDTVQSALTYTLGANVENLTLTGAAAINGTGNALNNVLTGNSAANVLTGGVGNDTYVVGAGDTVVENPGEGTDTVQSALTYTLTLNPNVENLTLTGAAAINGTGNTLNNVLTGNSANNTLTGGAGNDTMIGGAGNDIYVVDVAGDVVTEQAAAGTDTVQSALTYTLGANVENLTLTGAAAINGTGNTLNNVLTGNSANNTLTGGAGNDILNGVAGSDTLIGGTGNDTLTGGTGFDHFVFAAGDSGNTVGNIDVITDYTRGAVGTGDEFDYGATALVIGGGAGAASATQASINATTGVATFAGGSGTTLADALADIAARFDAVGGTDPGEFAFFKVNNLGNFHLYISDTTTGVGTGDVVVELQGITSILTIDTTAGDLTILTPVAPPVVLDLDGDGLEFVAMGDASNQALFDFNGDGTKETAAWVGPDDGFLVYDANADRRVNGGSEIAFADMTAGADTDLEALQAVFDSNQDGLLTAADEQFSRFGVWQDANGNGSTEGGEFKTLEEIAIVSLGMRSDGRSYDTATGQVTVHGEASFRYQDGSQGLLGDVSLAIGGPADSSADSQVGGVGNGTYQFNRGGGQDLVLSRQANDLRIAVYGSADQVTGQNWYSGASYQVETIQAGNWQTLVSTQVNQLIDAMAGFTSNNNGMAWDQGIAAKPEEVQAVVAASCQ